MRGADGHLRTVADASTVTRDGRSCADRSGKRSTRNPRREWCRRVCRHRHARSSAWYVQILCVRADCRQRGLGSSLLRWAEERIFRDSSNVFICVSSFNAGARRLYERHGFELVGTLRELLVPGHDELLLRKTKGTWKVFKEMSEGADDADNDVSAAAHREPLRSQR
jgi:GNAT superfamily N-acetyltransferase